MSRSRVVRLALIAACAAAFLFLFVPNSLPVHGSPDPQATAPALDANDVIFADQLVKELPPRSLTAALSRPASRCTEDGVALYDRQTGDTRVIDPADCTQAPLHGPHCGSCGNEDMWSPDGRYLAYTVRAESGLATRETRFYDVVKDEVVPLEEVSAHTTSWLPYWSPQWDYYVELIGADDPDLRRQCNFIDEFDANTYSLSGLVITETKTGESDLALCVNRERIEVERWLDENHAVVIAQMPYDSASPCEKRYVVTLDYPYVVALGESLKYEAVWSADSLLLARSKILNPSWDPIDCVINVVRLDTLVSRDIEPTLCTQLPDIRIHEATQQIAYLQSDKPPLGAERTPRVHLANLDDLIGRELPIDAANQLGTFSPDGRYLYLLLDDLHSRSRQLGFILGPQTDPRLLVFDLTKNEAAYEYQPETSDIAQSFFGPPFALAGYPSWSPDSTSILMIGRDQAMVLDVAAQTQVPVTKIQATDTFRVTVEWYGEDGLLLVEASPTDPAATATLGRWVIDPSLS
jgi:hypothetical protein